MQDGYDSLQAFSEAQDVQLNYNEDGQLVDRGDDRTGAEAIMALLTDDWHFPVVESEGGLDPNDPLVNTASEYMYQMATIVYHTLHGEQTVVLTEGDIARAIERALAADGTYNGAVRPTRSGAEPASLHLRVDGRYWTEFDRSTRSTARPVRWHGPARHTHWSPSSASAPSPTAAPDAGTRHRRPARRPGRGLHR